MVGVLERNWDGWECLQHAPSGEQHDGSQLHVSWRRTCQKKIQNYPIQGIFQINLSAWKWGMIH